MTELEIIKFRLISRGPTKRYDVAVWVLDGPLVVRAGRPLVRLEGMGELEKNASTRIVTNEFEILTKACLMNLSLISFRVGMCPVFENIAYWNILCTPNASMLILD